MNLGLFQNPPKEYRPIPFWSWNDRLQPDELRRQIGEMDSQGWGGFFMHSRIGLETPYMSEEWMRCVGECIDEAGTRGMGAWLYDEDKWPSGYAGGAVPMLSGDFREKALFVSEGSIPYPTDEIKAGKLRISEEVNIDAKNIIRCLARFDEINATAATVRINGQKAGDIIWGPYEIDITRYVHTGKNRIEIEMVNSLHNLLGPHHDVRGEVLPFAGPGQFDDRDNWTDAYYFRPFGVSGAVLWLSEDAVI